MKTLILLFLSILGLNSQIAWASTLSPLERLNAMVSAHKQSNFELWYVLQQGQELDAFRYRHFYSQQQEYAQLQNLDDPSEQVVLRHQEVSYLSPHFPSFTIKAENILDNLPAVFYTDFNTLSGYQFEDLGKEKVAQREAHLIRLTPKDPFRYRYLLWLDENSHLLLKSVLLDENENILEQFKVINFNQQAFTNDMNLLEKARLPAISPLTQGQQITENRQFWVPDGFKLIKKGYETLAGSTDEKEPVESYLYSDGIASFNIYISANQGLALEQLFVQRGKMSIFNQTIGQNDVTIIGDIPIHTAKAIVDRLK